MDQGVINTARDVAFEMQQVAADLRAKAGVIDQAYGRLRHMIEQDEDAFEAHEWLIEVSRATSTTVREVVHCSNVHLESLVRHGGECMSRIGRPVR